MHPTATGSVALNTIAAVGGLSILLKDLGEGRETDATLTRRRKPRAA